MRLHLGCGQHYLEGYLNIDFPLSEHSVQQKSIADEHHDILSLSYDDNSVDEVRLHHVFEHFDRPTACGLVASWNCWLKINGTLRIEVPDFESTAKAALSIFNSKSKKKVALRHLFGSHEAVWAVHYEGYSEWLLRELMILFGFKVLKVIRNSWRGTYNIEIIAQKEKTLSQEELTGAAKCYLEGLLVDDTESELLDIWLKSFIQQLEKTSR